MKKVLTVLALLSGFLASAQCSLSVSCYGATCYGGCDGFAIAYPNGVPPFNFTWMPGGQTTQTVNGLCPGTYTVVMTDSAGCSATAQCTVTQPPQLQAIVSNVVNPSCPSCCDGSMSGSATGGIGSYIFMWSGPNGFTSSGANIANLCAGTYLLCVTDANGCYSCDTVTISSPLSIAGNSASENITVTNSGNGIFQLNASFQTAQSGDIVVTNVMGQDVLAQHFSSGASLNNSIDLSDQPAGMYFVSVITASGVRSVRIVK